MGLEVGVSGELSACLLGAPHLSPRGYSFLTWDPNRLSHVLLSSIPGPFQLGLYLESRCSTQTVTTACAPALGICLGCLY